MIAPGLLLTGLLPSAHAGAADRRIEVAVRGGGAYFQPFPFVSVGGEARVRLVAGLRATAALEVWGTHRIPPPEVQLEEGTYGEWNWMQPAALGAVYAVSAGPIDPYGGAELVAVNHVPGAWTVGGRVRGGVDYFVIPHFGLNANASAGFWSGKGWSQLEDGADDSGPVFQGTLGVVVGF